MSENKTVNKGGRVASPALRFSSASMEPLQLVRPPDVMKLTRWNRTRLRLVSPWVRRGPTPSPDAPGLILRLAGCHPPCFMLTPSVQWWYCPRRTAKRVARGKP